LIKSLLRRRLWLASIATVLAAKFCPPLFRVSATGDAPPSVQPLMQATGGGQIPAAMLDLNNDDSTVSNGGAFIDPTYIVPC
jgi:hypothetical protein